MMNACIFKIGNRTVLFVELLRLPEFSLCLCTLGEHERYVGFDPTPGRFGFGLWWVHIYLSFHVARDPA